MIELLAVILILGIIALISTTFVLHFIETAKSNALGITADAIDRAAETKYASKNASDRYYFIDGSNYNKTNDKLDFKGQIPHTGLVDIAKDGKIAIVIYDGIYCATKAGDEENAVVNKTTLENCKTYNVIKTDDEWTNIADDYNTPLDELLDLNEETDSNSSTIGRDIKVPIIPITDPDSLVFDDSNTIYYNRPASYAYTDASTKLELDDNDDGTGQIDLGFDFNFGGVTYNTIYPSSDGYIAFNMDDAYEYSNELINDWLTFPIIAVYWTDLYFDFDIMPDSGIYYTIGTENGKNYILVEWRDITDLNSDNQDETTTGDFEVKLYEDGTIKTFYKDVEFEGLDYRNGIDATAGVMVNETNYNSYSFNSESITNNMAIEFYLAPGTITPGDPCFLVDSSSETLLKYKYTSSECPSDVIIPETIDGVTIKHIGEFAFANAGVTSVVFPNTLLTIGYDAFISDQLTSITLPTSLTTIDVQAFCYNELTSLEIPNSVTDIGANAFRNNNISGTVNLTNVTTIGMYAFNENHISTISIPSLTGPIPDSAFRNNSITSVIIPSGVTEIGYCAFCYNQLTSATIPNTVTSIADAAFSNNSLTTINIPSSVNSVGYRSFGWNNLSSITMGKTGTTIGEFMLGDSATNIFRTAYNSGGAGIYNGSQYGSWTKQ